MAAGQGRGVVLGYLRYILGMDTLAFEEGAASAERRMQKTAAKFTAAGKTLTTAVSAPLVGFGAAILKMGGDFESGMNRVAISTQGTAAELKAMNDLALKLGKDTSFGATDAADAMDELAKNGLSARQILDGAATAAVNLAAAAGSELSPAAKAISDVMAQFKIQAKDLPDTVNQITGAVNQSKLDFVDFAGAIAQAGGVAGGLGVDFKDFNAVIAGTSSLFASGSDAGTSFKTFLLALPGNSKPAIMAIKQYGLEFYDAQGNMRGLGAIAEELRTKLGGLNDETKTEVLKTIFGTDAMRTAIGLMDQGAKGLDDIKTKIAATDASAQSAERLKGFNGQLEQMKGAIETLAITIAQSGLLEVVTDMVTRFGNFVDSLAEISPEFLKWGTVVAVVVAAIGPLLIGIGAIIGALAPLAAVITAAVTAAGGFAAGLAVLAPPVLAVAAALGAAWLAWKNWDKVAPILKGLWDSIQEALGPAFQSIMENVKSAFSDAMGSEVWGNIKTLGEWISNIAIVIAKTFAGEIPGIIQAFGALFAGAINLVIDTVRLVVKILSGDWSGAWKAAGTLVSHVAQAIIGVFGGLVNAVMGSVQGLVGGINDWMGGRLFAIFNRVKTFTDAAKKWFFGLYDAVVGHSYIPDMVDEIGQNMGRLQKLMVDPAQKMTQTTGDAFRAMASRTAAIMDELFPKTAALREEMEKLIALQNDTTLSPAAKQTALDAQIGRVLDARDAARVEVSPAPVGDVQLPAGALDDAYETMRKAGQDAATQIGAANDNIAQGFDSMAQSALGSLQSMVDGIRNGDWISVIGNIASMIGQITGNGTFSAIGSVLGGGGGFGGFRAAGGAVSSGKTYMVGERGPEMFTSSRSGYIVPNDKLGGRRGGNVIIHANDAVLASTVRGWVQEGMTAAQQGAVATTERRGARRARSRAGK